MNDHDLYEALKRGDEAAWATVRATVVDVEARVPRNADLMRKWSVTADDLMGMLYEEMVGGGKLALYRDDGGSLVGWMRLYVRGYVTRSNPAAHGEFSIEATAERDEKGEEMQLPWRDVGVERNEAWLMTHVCFRDLWNDDPRKAYVLLLRTRFHQTSQAVADFLGIQNPAAVDKIFSRAVQDMRAAWVRHDRKDGLP